MYAGLNNAQQDLNDRIKEGLFTFMLHLDKLKPGPDQALVTNLFEGMKTDNPPKFNGADCWPVSRASLNSTDIANPRVYFEHGALAENTWSSGPKDIAFTLEFLGFPISITMYQARASFKLAKDQESAGSGQIGGILKTSDIRPLAKKVLGTLYPTLCSFLLPLNAFLDQLERTSDIMIDGQPKPNAVCDGISIGIGFTMKKVNLGQIAQPASQSDGGCK